MPEWWYVLGGSVCGGCEKYAMKGIQRSYRKGEYSCFEGLGEQDGQWEEVNIEKYSMELTQLTKFW